jgi:hypothetical protein
LVSSKTHSQPEEEDPADEGTKAEEQAIEKERDKHFNTNQSVIP